jgi:hypothetical protein
MDVIQYRVLVNMIIYLNTLVRLFDLPEPSRYNVPSLESQFIFRPLLCSHSGDSPIIIRRILDAKDV